MADWRRQMVLEMAGELRDMADEFSEEMQRCRGHGHHHPGCGEGDGVILAVLGLVVTAVIIFTIVKVARKQIHLHDSMTNVFLFMHYIYFVSS